VFPWLVFFSLKSVFPALVFSARKVFCRLFLRFKQTFKKKCFSALKTVFPTFHVIQTNLKKVFSSLKSVLRTFHAIWTNHLKKSVFQPWKLFYRHFMRFELIFEKSVFQPSKCCPDLSVFQPEKCFPDFSRDSVVVCGLLVYFLWSVLWSSVFISVVISGHFCCCLWSLLLSSVFISVIISGHVCDHQWSCLWSSVVFCSIFCGYFCGHPWLLFVVISDYFYQRRPIQQQKLKNLKKFKKKNGVR